MEAEIVATGRFGEPAAAGLGGLLRHLEIRTLDYGDCMSYATAVALDVPLLYKGGDFDLTDVRSAII